MVGSPFGCGGAGCLYPSVSGVVLLVGFRPFDQGTRCSWWVRKSRPTRVPMDQAFSQSGTTPAIGQGSNALLKGCLIPKNSLGHNCIMVHVAGAVCVVQLERSGATNSVVVTNSTLCATPDQPSGACTVL